MEERIGELGKNRSSQQLNQSNQVQIRRVLKVIKSGSIPSFRQVCERPKCGEEAFAAALGEIASPSLSAITEELIPGFKFSRCRNFVLRNRGS